MSRALSNLAGATSAIALQDLQKKTIKNEPKRNFYENEQHVVPLPGTVTPSTAAEAEILGPRSLINGATVCSAALFETGFRAARQALYDAYTTAYDCLHDKKHVVLKTELQVTNAVSALHSRHEDLFPNSMYIVIAGLSGNIMARKRVIVARVVYPFALGVTAFGYFLPQTFRNTAEFLWRVEQRALPIVAQLQVAAMTHANRMASLVKETAVSIQQKVQETWENMRQKISKVTGLNIDEEVLKK